MMCSANEVMTLAAKAARGAGAPPGQATDFGKAALCHLISGRDTQDLLNALNALPGGPILDLPLFFLRCAEEAVDDRYESIVDPTPIFLSYLEAQPFASEADLQEDGKLHTRLLINRPAQPKPVSRLDLPEKLAGHMKDLAARLLVPESDISRLSGAGAGLTDND
jgi:hypothetical protein